MALASSESDVSRGESRTIVAPEGYYDIQRPYMQLKCLNEYRLAEIFTDYTVVIGERRFPTHRVVLMTLSEYFKAKILRFEDQNNELILDNANVDPEVFLAILEYTYTGQLDLTNDNVQSLLVAANYFNIPYVERECQSFMIFHFEVENICQVLEFSSLYFLSSLRLEAEAYFTKNLIEAINSRDVLDMDPKVLEQMFSNDNIALGGTPGLKSAEIEATIFRAVLLYQSRKLLDPDPFEMLLRTVRLPHVHIDEIQKIRDDFATLITSSAVLRQFLTLHSWTPARENSAGESSARESGATPIAVPESWQRKRKSAFYEFVHKGRRYGLPYADQRLYPSGFDMCDPELEIASISIWIRQVPELERGLLGGITVRYRKENVDVPDLNYCKGSFLSDWQHHQINLLPEESIKVVIIWVHVGLPCVICINFVTSTDRHFGPYGTPIGNKYIEQVPYFEHTGLYSISCDGDLLHGASSITNFVLKWIRF